MYKKLLVIIIGAILLAGTAHAVPWCHKGTKVQIADVSWSEASILANFLGSVPGGVTDINRYITFTSINDYAAGFAGGGGGFGGFSVPGSGSVRAIAYAPSSYVSGGAGVYSTSHGINFRLIKCYTIPPLTQHFDIREVAPEDGGIIFEPYEDFEVIRRVWNSNNDR